ncbi:glycoside hydrolase [Paenibacillus sp. IB182496]|uniref:Glycoside hydrolase n=1 Tax=Paenibacillus sabuli TaxID=2772509 RepID=A0A927BY52_9BACL|nr:glycosyl hydrolase family 18 protein [Paenibacillus sabuli]MBD2847639.1 glycoside hydrolase [Paenibacillus sabuli]
MRKSWIWPLAALLLLQAALGVPAAAASSGMTQYRVYQNDNALREFATREQAVRYAASYAYSHVERIADRAWIWDNLPRYKVYQSGKSRPQWEYAEYADALAKARTLRDAHIRDLQRPGWVYSNHTQYRLYQGDKTMPEWEFAALDDAKAEAQRWSNAHIMKVSSNSWIWDNLSETQKEAQRSGPEIYELRQDGKPAGERYSFLLDAIRAAAGVKNSQVYNTVSGEQVHSNVAPYRVLQNGREIRTFFGLDNAVQYAKRYAGAQIVRDAQVWWTNIPYLQVKQGDKSLRYVHTREAAVELAARYADSRVLTEDGRTIWSNLKKLLYLGWNGSSRSDTIRDQLVRTQGLDIDSPTWFELAAADGSLRDTSDAELARELRGQGMQVMPLVHNQFDPELTEAFLADKAAQKRFVDALIERLTALQADGVNLDFEAIKADDRARYTAFVGRLSAAARQAGLTLSIDLPRGSLSWNHKTAYDHTELAELVDYVVIMAYDQFYKGSDSPGSVSGLQWTEEGVKQFLSYGIPRSKLVLGIPYYMREWQLDASGQLIGNRTLLMKDLPDLLASVQATSQYDPVYGQDKYTYQQGGSTYVFWAETPDTVLARIDIAKQYDLAGVAAWRLGYEPSNLWTSMLREK